MTDVAQFKGKVTGERSKQGASIQVLEFTQYVSADKENELCNFVLQNIFLVFLQAHK